MDSGLSDEMLVSKIVSGNPGLYVHIINRYQNKLLRYAYNLVRDEHRAIDIVQESFVKAYVNLRGFDISKKFSSWVYRIVHNEAINIIKKNERVVLMQEDEDFASDESLEDDFDQAEIRLKLRDCLDKIPVPYSEVLILFYLDEKSYEEISDILRIPMGTIATRISRGKKSLKKICQKIR